jgi:adenylate kinase family enzyme
VIRSRYDKQWVAAAAPVLKYYTGRGLVARINASAPVEAVGRDVDSVIDRLDGRA